MDETAAVAEAPVLVIIEPATPSIQDDLHDELLVEEISIDGMCGVY